MTISIVGTGNVAFHLVNAFYHADIEILNVFSRNEDNGLFFKYGIKTTKYDKSIITKAQVIILAIPDDKIPSVSEKIHIHHADQLVVHTAGGVGIKAISDHIPNRGVFYPLQTFRKSQFVNMRKVPILINGLYDSSIEKLNELASYVSEVVKVVPDDQKHKIHAAAVVVNNFINYLIGQSQVYIKKEKIDFGILHPLLNETIRKALLGNALGNQTGPAVRNDKKTIDSHLDLLQDTPELSDIYKFLSNQISNHYESNR